MFGAIEIKDNFAKFSTTSLEGLDFLKGRNDVPVYKTVKVPRPTHPTSEIYEIRNGEFWVQTSEVLYYKVEIDLESFEDSFFKQVFMGFCKFVIPVFFNWVVQRRIRRLYVWFNSHLHNKQTHL
jgi:hypothetical protein